MGKLAVRGLRSRRAGNDDQTVRKVVIGSLAAAIVAGSILSISPALGDPVRWTPDALFYEARVLEVRGADHQTAVRETFGGPISARLRLRDPEKTGDPNWVRYNEPFYERRVAVPLAGAALYPVAGERSLLYISIAGYVATMLALFGLLLLRFRTAIAAAVTAATILLPALAHHSSYPLTDSWGLALEITAFAGAILTLERSSRWLAVWVAAIAVLAFTRDSTWIPVLAAGWCALRYRSRATISLFATGVAAALPALVLFRTPVRELLALLVNGSQPSADTSWSFIARHYPDAVLQLARDNAGFLRRGEWYTGLFLVGGVALLLLLGWKSRTRSVTTTLMTAGAVLALGYVLAAPVFSAFRLELVFVPMAAYGFALAAERLAQRQSAFGRLALPAAARPRRQ